MTQTDDPFELNRFLRAQEGVYARVCSELKAGEKRSHWMWFIFPQLKGLGSSSTARTFAIASLDEARAYLAHPLLGERLRDCTRFVNAVRGRDVEAIFGYPDHMKFHSSMTLFALAEDPPSEASPFTAALRQYFAGEEDRLTVDLLARGR